MPKIDIFANLADHEKQQTVTLTITHDCNLRCRYCFEPNKSRDYYMDFNMAQRVVTEYMQATNEFTGVCIDFFGGEPMLAFDLIRDLVDWFHTRSWHKDHIFSIGTNGTILTDEMRSWLIKNKNCVMVAISMDGNKIAHDLNRSNSYDKVRENLPFFMEHWPNQIAKMTINAETIPYVAESIIEFEELGVPFSSNIVFEDIWGSSEKKAALLEIYTKQLDRLVEYYVAHPDLYPARIVDIKPEYTLKDNNSIGVGEGCVRYCGSGHEMVTVDVDGSRSPCHRFSPWITGKPLPDISQVNHQEKWKPEKCAKCQLIKICPTCAGFNWEENGDSGIRTTYHCDAFKLETQASAKLQAMRLLQQKPENLAKLPPQEAQRIRIRIDALLDIAENGI